MAEKVKLSKDGNSIDFVQSDSIPTSVKKFRQSPEIEGFYRFIFENDLQKETYEILEAIINDRKAKKKAEKAEAAPAKKAEAAAAKKAATPPILIKKAETKKVEAQAAKKTTAPVVPVVKKAAPVVKAAAPTKKAAVKPAAKKATANAKKTGR